MAIHPMPDPYEEGKKQSVDYWRQRAERAERELARIEKAWADVSDLIQASRMFWAAMEKIK
jgi:hypothetical protein